MLILTNHIVRIGSSAGSYTWSIDSSLGAGVTYGLISLDSDPATFHYLIPFHIVASSGTGSSSSSISSTVGGCKMELRSHKCNAH